MRLAPLLAILVCACATSPSRTHETSARPSTASAATAADTGPAASAVLEPRSDSTTSGTARFVAASGGGLAVHVEVQGAAPGEHGVHIHEKGDCSDPKATSAGGHYNPNAGAHHGGPKSDPRHGGDLGNLTVDASGTGSLDVVVPDLSLDSLQNGVVGKSIVVHEKADDLKSDPAGNSGSRVACGRIQAPTLAH